MKMKDVRWQQRFDNFLSALKQVEQGIQIIKERELSDLEKQGVIQSFEFTHELAWNVLKDYLEYQGIQGLIGSRDTTREAFQKNLIVDGEAWMEMIKSRNLTSHTYNKSVANKVVDVITERYFKCFIDLKNKMSGFVS